MTRAARIGAVVIVALLTLPAPTFAQGPAPARTCPYDACALRLWEACNRDVAAARATRKR